MDNGKKMGKMIAQLGRTIQGTWVLKNILNEYS